MARLTPATSSVGPRARENGEGTGQALPWPTVARRGVWDEAREPK
uniref:Uncharacterized protein n=1 Tax=Arundo donax TaxID=35708 RepID=A0A0A9FDH3_ARUDO